MLIIIYSFIALWLIGVVSYGIYRAKKEARERERIRIERLKFFNNLPYGLAGMMLAAEACRAAMICLNNAFNNLDEETKKSFNNPH